MKRKSDIKIQKTHFLVNTVKMASLYKLRCTIVGHDNDVRTLATYAQLGDTIISGSRDKTSRIWTPKENDVGFQQHHTMRDHSNFVSSVCIAPPTSIYEQGLILTGSNDNLIIVYNLQTYEKLYQLTGHEGTVCALAVGKAGTIISGSWDKTAKVWIKERCVMTLTGHEAAVWAVCVLADQGLMLTGSADKTIRVWKAGRCETVITGHTDCVRDLAVMNNGQFLSCSNDCTIRRWLTSGECLHVYHGHDSFVYSLAVLPNEDGFVSTGEDKTLRVWHNTTCVQTINHPCHSVWTVCVLHNGDLASGGSDAVIRVFTKAPDRMASAEDQKAFDELVNASNVPSKIAGVKLEDIPGMECLQNPGVPGQQRMVRSGEKVMMYSWNGETNQWDLLGDVTGSGSDSHATTGKTLYRGKEYDFVFSVDIDPNVPALKLPYNLDEDPWMAAHDFLQKNDLSPMFLDQVANFILTNIKGHQPQQADTGAFCDPFTGTSRYIPSNISVNNGSSNIAARNEYPSKAAVEEPTAKPKPPCYFPMLTYLTIDTANEKQIIDKLTEFNEKVGPSFQIQKAVLSGLSELIAGKETACSMSTLKQLLKWPKEYVFPALDVLRISIKYPQTNEYFCSHGNSKELLDFLLQFICVPSTSNANRLLSLRVLCNMFAQKTSEEACFSERDAILPQLTNVSNGATKSIQVAIATLLLNYSVAFCKKTDAEGKSQCMVIAKQLLKQGNLDQEAIFRLLVMLGNLVHEDEVAVAIGQSLGLEKYIKDSMDGAQNIEKVSTCANSLMDVLKVS